MTQGEAIHFLYDKEKHGGLQTPVVTVYVRESHQGETLAHTQEACRTTRRFQERGWEQTRVGNTASNLSANQWGGRDKPRSPLPITPLQHLTSMGGSRPQACI